MDECIIFKHQIVESDTLHQYAVYTRQGSHETASSIASEQTLQQQIEYNLLILFNRSRRGI